MATALLQFEHHLCQTLMSDFILQLLFVRLGNLIILAIDAAQVAVAKEDVAGTSNSHQGRFFPEMRCVGRDNW